MGLFRRRSRERERKLGERMMMIIIIIITEIKAMGIQLYVGLFFVLVGRDDVMRCTWRWNGPREK